MHGVDIATLVQISLYRIQTNRHMDKIKEAGGRRRGESEKEGK